MMNLVQSLQDLIHDPSFADSTEEGPRADAISEVGIAVLAHEIAGLVCLHHAIIAEHIRLILQVESFTKHCTNSYMYSCEALSC